MTINNLSELVLTFKGGGTFTDLQPLFVKDEQTLIVAWKNYLFGYNIVTGKKVIQFTDLHHDVVGFSLVTRRGKNTLIACDKLGNVMFWDITTGKRVSSRNLPVKQVETFCCISRDGQRKFITTSWTRKRKTLLLVSEIDAKLMTFKSYRLAINNTRPFYFDVGVSDLGLYAVCVQDTDLYYVKFVEKNGVVRHLIHAEKKFLSVRCFNEGIPQVLTGDSKGVLTLWQNLHKNKPAKAVYHWHTLPLKSVAFSSSGTQFYSGGQECVAVRWEADDVQSRKFIPRLPSAVQHISVSQNNDYVAITTEGDGIYVVDNRLQHVSIIRHLVTANSCDAGITYNPRSKCLVLNGSLGNVQFYSPGESLLLYTIDVVGQNKLTNERDKTLLNIDVKHVAVDTSGWMATVEECTDFNAYELRLKFWYMVVERQEFTLNTSVEYPHEQSITAIAFRRNEERMDVKVQCVTTSEDGKFKIWHLIELIKVDGDKSLTWRPIATGYYKNDLLPRSIAYCTDGSTMAISFGPELTLWLSDSCELSCTLVQSVVNQKADDIQFVHFGEGSTSTLIISASRETVCIWDFLARILVSRINVCVAFLTKDPFSQTMAICTTDNTILLFKPDSDEPFMKHCLRDRQKVVSISFVPSNGLVGRRADQFDAPDLYYLNDLKELYCLSTKASIKSITAPAELKSEPESVKGRYCTLIVSKKSTDASTKKSRKLAEPVEGDNKYLKELLETPLHTQMHLSLLANRILESMILKRKKRNELSKQIEVESPRDNKERVKPVNSDANIDDIRIKTTSWMSIF